ncbi:uncharacterized protein rab11fip5a isoform X1 [Xiphias gladius]|uniref:uncharacterized protein rab11fip5a isoform X1 n=1 Tax=Xiphias gladius TaxID=8245 RepID=UPI001A9814BA|nr:uncharacterized protein rab11fip5a isoform X1 [Xiphias gladius]
MYDLVMKDKGASTFSKLKERMRGKRRSSDDDSSSAVLPGGYGSLYRMRHRLPSDGGGEEDYEDDEGGEARRSKMRTFFLRGKLRKSSDTRSSTSLGSESSESSSRGGSLSPTAGISVVVSDLSNSPSNSSNLTADNSPEHTANTSPKSSSLKCEFGDEVGEITIAVPQLTVSFNGSHAYSVQPLDPGSGKPADALGLGPLQKSLPLSMSLQNLSPRADTDARKGPAGDGRRWSFDKPGKEEKAAIAAALEQSGPLQAEEEECLTQAALPKAASTAELESHGKKQRRNLFSHGLSQSKDGSEQAPAATEEKHKGWFGSKDSHSKPSLVVSPKLKPSTDPHPPPLPSSHHTSGPPVHPASLVSPLHHTNPFCHSQTTPPPISPCNPFFSLLQHNPFYEDMLTIHPLKPLLPPLPYLSSSRPPIAQLFPQASNPNPIVAHDNPTTQDSIIGTDAKIDLMAKVEKQQHPPAAIEREKPLSEKSSNPFMSAGELEPDLEWDESFEAFAAGRLQSPEDLTTDCKTQQNTPSDYPQEHCNNKGTSLPTTDADQNTNVNDALHRQPCRKFLSEAHKATSLVTNTNTHHLDAFAQFLETIPEHRSFENDSITLYTSADSPKLDACTETNQANSTTNTNDITNTNMHQAPCHTSSTQLNSSSPDPGSAEEDFLSCVSSYSDKFSASSSGEAEAQKFESDILGFEKSSESGEAQISKPSKSEKSDITDRPNDQSSLDVAQQTVSKQQDSDERVDSNDLGGSLAPQSPVHQQLMITAREMETEGADVQTLNISNVMYPDLLPNLSELQPKSNISSQSDDESREKGINELNSSIVDFSKEFNDSSVNNSTDVKSLATLDDELSSTLPSLYIITSSPEMRQSSWASPFGSTSVGGQDASQCSLEPFGAFGDLLNTPPGQDLDNTLLHTRMSDQSSSSFLQSLYVSTDSQDYQTCESHPSSKCSMVSEPDATLHSANSTLCVELSEIQTTADAAVGLEDSTSASKLSKREINRAGRVEESSCQTDAKTATLETDFMIGNDFGLQVLPATLTDFYTSCDPKRLSARGVDDVFSKCPQAQSLHRSQSEGTLTPAFDELLLPSFGSDPGAIQELSSAQPGPDLSCLTSFAPFLTPEISSSPVALCSFPALATASARSPSGTARAAVPKPEETQQQQAANQQNSPHPVKPLTTAMLAEEKRTEGRSVLATGLEKLKSTIHPGRSSQLSEQETDRKKSLTEGAGSYYHLTHSELVALVVQREAELERQKAESERQRVLLAKREVELKKLKPQVRDLEDYIDTLLVRIMEQKPTLLQVRSKFK